MLVAASLSETSSGVAARHAASYAGPHAAVRIRGVRSRRYRSALEDAADAEANFDGRYVLAEIGCGAGCLEVAAVDAETGAVAWLAQRVSGWPKSHPDPLEYRVDSSLLRIYGQLDGAGSAGPHAFVFDGRRFTPVASP
jgi:hypothetical protein